MECEWGAFMSEKLWYLKDCRLFERLSAEDLGWLEARLRLRRFPKNSPVYLPIDAAQGVLLVADGQVKICHLMRDGRQSILAFVNPGEIFGELAIFEPRDADEYAETTQPSTLVLILADALQELLGRNPDLALGVTRLIGLRRRRIERRLRHLLFQSNRERLSHLLLELAEDYGRRVNDGGVEVSIRLSHQDLASVIGSTRESVTLLLGKMQQEELLTLERKRITIRSLQGLAESVAAPVPRIVGDEAGSRAAPGVRAAY